jgi:hypothetical protein
LRRFFISSAKRKITIKPGRAASRGDRRGRIPEAHNDTHYHKKETFDKTAAVKYGASSIAQ